MDASVDLTVICFSIYKDSPEFLAMKRQMDVSSLSRRGCYRITRIPPITGWHWLFPSSCARTLIGFPYGSLSLNSQGKVRGCHVPQKYPDRLGAAFTPKAQHLRQRSENPLYLALHLLVQAFQHLWLVLY